MIRYLLIAILLTSCYGARQARNQFSRAAAYDPAIPSEYCARTYPPSTVTTHDTLTTTDSIYIEGAERLDTVLSHDTLRITRTVTLPSQVVTRTVHVIDTVRVENTARLAACQVDNSRLVAQTDTINASLTKARHTKTTLWWLVVVLGLSTGGLLANKLKLFA